MSDSNNKKVVELEIPIYRQKLTLVKASSYEDIKDLFPPECFDFGELYAHTVKWHRQVNGVKLNCIYVVLNDQNDERSLTHGVIAHEALHVVQFTFEHIGAEIDNNNPEPANYLLEYVVDLIYKFLEFKVR